MGCQHVPPRHPASEHPPPAPSAAGRRVWEQRTDFLGKGVPFPLAGQRGRGHTGSSGCNSVIKAEHMSPWRGPHVVLTGWDSPTRHRGARGRVTCSQAASGNGPPPALWLGHAYACI